jgi:nicotinamide-nucleotide amidase
VAQRITAIAGSSAYFGQAIVTYSNEAKTALLGVERQSLEQFGAVSEQVALEMVRGVRRVAGSDYALSLTGIAGPGGGTAEKPVGLVFIGLAGPAGEKAWRFQFPGDRNTVRERAASQALDLLRRALLAAQAAPSRPPKKRG